AKPCNRTDRIPPLISEQFIVYQAVTLIIDLRVTDTLLLPCCFSDHIHSFLRKGCQHTHTHIA
ncbi:hypothetical protein, partial [Yersinia intermedia]|uniref:hypothetical protein n=1 Tax=Yersinia intermedia TaxID=631 RepID=UPI0022446054